jgi:glycosyltransferase involved in cell wall biosynthesis
MLHAVPVHEVMRLLVRKSPWRESYSSEGAFSVHGVHRSFDKTVSQNIAASKANLIYGYEGGALNSFRRAKKMGIKTVYEIQSSYWYWNQYLFKNEVEKYSGKRRIPSVLKDSDIHLKWKDEELSLADYVIVPSCHVKSTMGNVIDERRIRVMFYGAPKVEDVEHRFSAYPEKLRILYVGGVHFRKGIKYLFEALDLLDFKVEVCVIGRLESWNKNIIERLRSVNWYKSMAHEDVIKIMREYDLLVHPSLTEGCSLVALEALSVGLPIIVTENSGVADVIRDGEQGYVVSIRDAGAIAEKLSKVHRHREVLKKMSISAQEISKKMSWDRYKKSFVNNIRSILDDVDEGVF